MRYGRVQGKGSSSPWSAHQASKRLASLTPRRLMSFAVDGEFVDFCQKTQSAPGCGMGGFKGKGLVLRGMLIRPQKKLASSAPSSE